MSFGFPGQEAPVIGARTVANAIPAERLAFIRRTYSLFFISLVLAVVTGWFTIQSGAYMWFIRHPIIALVIYFGGVFLVQGVSRTPGINVVALFGYAAFTGAYFSLVALASYFVTGGSFKQGTMTLTGGSWHLAGQAFGLTLIVFGGLTLFTFISRKDFSFLGGFLFIGLMLCLGLGIIAMIFGFPSTGLELLFCVAVVGLMAGYVLYDTSRIIHRCPTDAHVSAALAIYIDFAVMFVYILRILMILNSRR
jgi:FtsH-binding integral membrane protein